MYAQARGARKRRGGRKNAARFAKAELARAELAKQGRARAAETEDVLSDVPIYTYSAPEATAASWAAAALPFEAQATELVSYLTLKWQEHGDEWLTEDEIGEELLQAAGNCECADETAILDCAVPALKELILASDAHPTGLLSAISAARFALMRLTAQS
jgi:hypothetical protein